MGLKRILSSGASGCSLHGGACFRVEKARLVAWKRGPNNRKNEVKLPSPSVPRPEALYDSPFFVFFTLFFVCLRLSLVSSLFPWDRSRELQFGYNKKGGISLRPCLHWPHANLPHSTPDRVLSLLWSLSQVGHANEAGTFQRYTPSKCPSTAQSSFAEQGTDQLQHHNAVYLKKEISQELSGTPLHRYFLKGIAGTNGSTAAQIGGVLQYKLEVYCGVSLSPKLRSQQGTALQMGGVLW